MRTIRFYNILLPIWFLVFLPSPLWILLIPGNYLIDYLILRHCQKKLMIEKDFADKNAWKVCLAGFFSDLIGALFLFAWFVLLDEGEGLQILNALNLNPFRNIYALLITLAGIAIAGVMIYLLNNLIFSKKIGRENSRYIALRMALWTAPYLFLLPMDIFYR